MSTKCAWVDCSATSEHLHEDGWRLLNGHPGIEDGFYCPDHAGLIELCERDGGLFADDEPWAALRRVRTALAWVLALAMISH